MATRIRAIYENGQFRPLDEVDLSEGKQVEITFQEVDEEWEMVRARLGDMVVWADPNANPNPEVEQYAEEIDRALQGEPSLSEIIIQ